MNVDRQKRIFEELIFGSFPGKMAAQLYPGRNRREEIYKEGAYKVLEPRKDKPTIEHDALIHFYQVGNWSGKQKVKRRDGVSIEIKTSEDDIWHSDVTKYLGATRLFFIAVPADLLPAIIKRYANHTRRSLIGIINSDSGDIVVMPNYQDNDRARYNTLLAHCYTSAHRIPSLNNTEPFQMSRVHKSNCYFKYVCLNGLMVNEEYVELFKAVPREGNK